MHGRRRKRSTLPTAAVAPMKPANSLSAQRCPGTPRAAGYRPAIRDSPGASCGRLCCDRDSGLFDARDGDRIYRRDCYRREIVDGAMRETLGNTWPLAHSGVDIVQQVWDEAGPLVQWLTGVMDINQ